MFSLDSRDKFSLSLFVFNNKIQDIENKSISNSTSLNFIKTIKINQSIDLHALRMKKTSDNFLLLKEEN